MKKLSFSVQISAPRTRVWSILWDDATYRQWTSAFSEGSHAVSDWQEGSKILFLGPNGDGMVSRIARLIPEAFISFQHLGEMKNGAEVPVIVEGNDIWENAFENYTLRDHDGGTLLQVELDSDETYAEMFDGMFPKALAIVKSLAEAQKITPFLWFDERIEDAINLYTSIFPNSKIGHVARQGDAVFTADFSLSGQKFAALNGGSRFQLNPSISIFVVCESEAELDNAWQKLADGGQILMALDKYPWSEKYGWLQDRFGLSWQLSFGKIAEVGQKFTPTLMFGGAQNGHAEAAINLYTSIFKNTSVDGILRFGAGEPNTEGFVKHAQFKLDGQKFMALDGGTFHTFTFNEAFSFVISCETQDEIDYFWEKLTADGGEPSQCAWLKDRFGVSWQVVPPVLMRYLNDPNPAKAQSVMQAMLKMSKIEIAVLEQAYEQG